MVIDFFLEKWNGNLDYFLKELSFDIQPWWHNYLWWLIALSAFFFLLELIKPWRKEQPKFRKDFWLDLFYMFFNFSLFGIIIFYAASDVLVNLLNLGGIHNDFIEYLRSWPVWGHLLLGFIVRDFVQWWTHRLLHRVDFLWNFHKVHHSVEQMGFAAHLRYHWMENVVYRTIEYLPLAFIGIGLNDFFIIHIFTLAVGHYNHSNLVVKPWMQGTTFGALLGLFIAFVALDLSFVWGMVWMVVGAGIGAVALAPIMKYIFNGPRMHIWHHAHDLPYERRYGVNFALTLSVWDYLFRTAYIPYDGKDIKLGFPGVERFPSNFFTQLFHGWYPTKKEKRVVEESQE